MIRTKPRTTRSREMREDLAILMGLQRLPKVQKYGSASFANHRSPTFASRSGSDESSQQSSPEFNAENSGSMFLPPPLVTAAECRAARMGRLVELKPRNSRWPICSSQPITRVERTNPDEFRYDYDWQPLPFMLNCVQQPPSTPFGMEIFTDSGNSGSQNQSDSTSKAMSTSLLQSPWVNRSDLNKSSKSANRGPLCEVTSKYSVKQLIDSMCGDAPEIPEVFELFPHKITGKDIHVANERLFPGEKSQDDSCSPGKENNTLFMESVCLPTAFFDEPESGAAAEVPEVKSFVPPMPISQTLFDAGAPPPPTPPALNSGWNCMNMNPAKPPGKSKTVTFMDMESTKPRLPVLPHSLFPPPSPTPIKFNCLGEKISTPPAPRSTSTESSSPFSEITTSAFESPFFTDGLSYLKMTYSNGNGNDESPDHQVVGSFF